MLTSFFGKSNPVNYLIISVIILAGYFVSIFKLDLKDIGWLFWLEKTVTAVILVFLTLLLDFIIRKNHLTKNNTFGIFLFACFLLAMPSIFLLHTNLVATLFLLLAFRRILSFQSEKHIEKKILDASLWITFASFFYFWSLLFFLILYFALLRRQDTKYKELLMPIVGFVAMFIMAECYFLLLSNSSAWLTEWRLATSFNFSAYNQIDILLPITVISTLLIWSGIGRLATLSSLQKKDKPNAIIVLLSCAVTLLIAFGSSEKTGSEAVIIFGPLVIIITNYLEIIKEFWFKEMLLWLSVLLPIIVFLL